jgi:hypothetical protein
MFDQFIESPYTLSQKRSPKPEATQLLSPLRNTVWVTGIFSWLFGVSDRSIAGFADGYLNGVEFGNLLLTLLFFLGWLYMKPESKFESRPITDVSQATEVLTPEQTIHLDTTRHRMIELQDQHIIRQKYVLPFPHLCQIYHLLNLKHLETVHGFSLNNLKILKVSEFQPTAIGGIIKFQTMLDSPMNVLRIWRQPIVEVDLILHCPYTVELSIPVYNGKRITVLFNVIPLSSTEHTLYIDIYSDLNWFKPLLQVLLHTSACLTLYEDLPYLQALAKKQVERLARVGRITNNETMQLFKRFVDLYGTGIEAFHPRELLPEGQAL